MAIYIKGMEMPKSCWDCPMMYDYLYCVVTMDKRLKEDTRAASCPLVYIPEPHGRLIDADALKFYGNHIGDEYEDRFHDKQWVHRDEIDNAPTVIEGSGE